MPVYEAVYLCLDTGRYVRAQKHHLDCLYAAAGRTDARRGAEVDATTQLPYWVDRHLFKKARAGVDGHAAKRQRRGGG